MRNLFEIFVKINDQKFDICISDDKNLIKFCDIYPKLKEVVKIGANEDIDFQTHYFELIDHDDDHYEDRLTIGVQIHSFEHLIRKQSVICVKPKPTENVIIDRLNEELNAITNFPTINGRDIDLRPRDIDLRPRDVDLRPYLPVSGGHRQRKDEYRDTKEVSRHKRREDRDSSLKSNRTHESRDRHKYRDYSRHRSFDKRKESHRNSEKRTISRSPKHRRDEIRHKSHEVSGSHTPKSVPNDSPLIRCSSVDNYNQRKEIPSKSPTSFRDQNRRDTEISERDINVPTFKKRSNPQTVINKDFVSNAIKLKNNENIIRTFNQMIVEMNIGWNFKDNGDKYWKVLADKMCGTDNKYRYILTSEMCKTRFYLWTRFYAQNYDKLNGKLEPKLQKIFDCLKIVHTLDLNQLFSSQSSTYIKIKDILLKKEFREYFNKYLNHIRVQKLVTRETELIKDSKDRNNSTTKDNNCQTTDPILKQKNSVKSRIDLQKINAQNIQKNNKISNQKPLKESDFIPLNKRSDSRVTSDSHKSCEKQLNQKISNNRKEVSKQPNFIPLSRAPEPRNKIILNMCSDRVSRHSTKQSTDKPLNKDHKEIEVIVLD